MFEKGLISNDEYERLKAKSLGFKLQCQQSKQSAFHKAS
ncbi:hypothetical protein SynTAK9802_02233 [Synechococcus sp. TAK9802]|nr:hypothetical protein SynTAK9802_02233 [Synechococcus sp. TAK9802]